MADEQPLSPEEAERLREAGYLHKSELSNKGYVHRLDALGPLDGRYGERLEDVADIFSERGLIQARVAVELAYLTFLSNEGVTRPFSQEERQLLKKTAEIGLDEAEAVKEYETTGRAGRPSTNHDMKAVEYYIKAWLEGTSLNDCLEMVHFGLTSEDVNNLAYATMLREGVRKSVEPATAQLTGLLQTWAEQYADVPMLARTHGQPATPTTFGKEVNVFLTRLEQKREEIVRTPIRAKLNGASGNWNAHRVAFPDLDWRDISKRFIEEMDFGAQPHLEPNMVTTQIENHDSYVMLFHRLHELNGILLDFDQDMWRYISDGWVVQRPKPGEVGSSAMPHKVNPIDFENSEGNAVMAQGACEVFTRKLPVSRLQRDLSDSTVERNFGLAFGFTVLALNSARRGLGKCSVNETAVTDALNSHPEVVAEAYNSVLRAIGLDKPYEQLSALTRGRAVTMQDLHEFVDQADIPTAVKKQLKELTPANYLGYAPELARN